MREFTKLHIAVQAAAAEIKQAFDDAGLDGMFVEITVANDRYDGVDVKYTVAKGRYGSNSVTGNELAPAVTEFLRRNGWDISYNTKLITATKAVS